MDKVELLRLAERVEGLQGPDREVDDTIAEALFTGKHRVCVKGLSDEAGGMWMFTYPDGSIGSSLRFTGSLDAAMTLVERPAWIRIDEWPDEYNHTSASVQPIRDPQVASHCAKASTPALALCAAALRALAKEDS